MPTFQTPEPISVTVEIGVGDVRIESTDRTDTVVDVLPSDALNKADVTAASQTRVEYANGMLLVRAPKGWRQYTPRGGRESIDVHIGVPAGSHVHGDVGVAALRCTGRLGECRYKAGVGDIQIDEVGPLALKTGAGDIGIGRAVGDAEVTTGSGAMRIASVDGRGVVKNSNGDTWIGEITGELRVNAANGKIVVGRARSTVTAKTANGDVRLDQVERGAIVARTAFGKIDIGVRDGVAAWLDLDTAFGNVQSELAAVDGPGQAEDAVEVRARTAYGDITIKRSFARVSGLEEP